MAKRGKAFDRAKDQLRAGAFLMKMHKGDGSTRFYIVPGGSEVDPTLAALLISEPDVRPRSDGLFPGINQSWGILQ